MPRPAAALAHPASALIGLCTLLSVQRLNAQAPPGRSGDAAGGVPVAIRGATVIDVAAGRRVSGRTVLVRDGRIVEVGPATGARAVRIPAGARVVDGRGKFLIPGLWDMHVHTLRERRDETFFPLFVANGVLGVRDMGSWGANIPAWRAAAAAVPAPLVVPSGPPLDGYGPTWPWSIAVPTAADAALALDSLQRVGATGVKIMNLLTRDAYLAVLAEARRRGLPAAGHVPFAITAAEASDAGQRSLEHLDGLTLATSAREAKIRRRIAALVDTLGDSASTRLARWRLARFDAEAAATYDPAKAAALFARFRRNGTWQTPTLVGTWGFQLADDRAMAGDPALRYVPAALQARWASMMRPRRADSAANAAEFRAHKALVGAMARANVDLLAGSDATPGMYAIPGFALHRELELLVEAGVTPAGALRSATINAARYLGATDSLGTVAPGKRADLVLLDADPLDDIRHTRRIHAVIAAGRLLDRGALDRLLADAERAATAPPGADVR